jgi:hypothetical protein
MYLHKKGKQESEVNSVRVLVYTTETIYSVDNAFILTYVVNKYCLLVCDTIQYGRSVSMSQRNLLAPLSERTHLFQ